MNLGIRPGGSGILEIGGGFVLSGLDFLRTPGNTGGPDAERAGDDVGEKRGGVTERRVVRRIGRFFRVQYIESDGVGIFVGLGDVGEELSDDRTRPRIFPQRVERTLVNADEDEARVGGGVEGGAGAEAEG